MRSKLFCLFIVCCTVIPNNIIEAQSISQYSGLRRYIGKGAADIVDSAKLRITYSLDYVPDSTKPAQNLKDRKVLLIGDEVSHFYSYYVRQNDSALTADFDKGKNSAPLKWASDVQGEGSDIYFRFATGQQTVIEPVTSLSTYIYVEDAAIPQWNIGSDTCTILSYLCQKATVNFRGRDWTVWFSSGVPVSVGPWKLHGLPGLILKASDNRNHYVFECIGIEQLKQKKEPIITIGQRSFIKCSREEYRKAQKQFYENYTNALLSLGYNVIIKDNTGKTIETLTTPNKEFEEQNISMWMGINVAERYKKLPYNPIELE